jgi:hypothetical protein
VRPFGALADFTRDATDLDFDARTDGAIEMWIS